MNLKIGGKRNAFYQWDTGQYFVIEGAENCTEVHICHKESQNAIVCEIKEEDGQHVVYVPNILLQSDLQITAYLFYREDDGSQTQFSKSFMVNKRPKPEDYVYTETEVLNYQTLINRIEQIEQNGVSEDQIARAVEKYLEENPSGVNFETDKTLTLKDGILSVNTTNLAENDNTLPITSAGVYATVGNIEALLKTI